jgi:ribosomal-protein-alanine N-acetyltransferase
MVTLKADRLTLREFTRDDFDAVHHYASDPMVVKYMTWGPNTRAETRRFIEKNVQSQIVKPRTSYGLAITFEDNVIGGCGLTIHSLSDGRAEIGYCLRRENWGKGLGTLVATTLIEFGFKELGLHRIEAKSDTENHASYRIMEKNNMQREGILREEKNIRGEWRDSYIYSILEHEWSQ